MLFHAITEIQKAPNTGLVTEFKQDIKYFSVLCACSECVVKFAKIFLTKWHGFKIGKVTQERLEWYELKITSKLLCYNK